MFSVCICARFQTNSKEAYLTTTKCIFRYLIGSNNLGLCFKKEKDYILVGYCGVDYARDCIERKSTSGWCDFIGENLVSWKTKRQVTITLSTTEEKYNSVVSCCSQLLLINHQLESYSIH